MRCLYEVLEVSREADEAEIKSGYRKAALKWHPDKNREIYAEAEERFKEIQNAYEVLSDKHERAWYDSHRQDILRAGNRHQAGGGSQFAGGEAPEDEVELFSFFSSTCFSGYKDGPTGFYGVYEGLFEQLAKQEVEFAKVSEEALGAQDLPKFGTSQSNWPDVAAFYGAWSSFATCKSFSWADQYNPASAPNRKIRRLMEEDNKKARKAKRRKFNETVRELISFVKKRDKRVAAHQAEEAKRRLEKEAEDQIRREEERKLRLQRAREYEEAEWAQLDQEDEDSEIEAENIQDDLYCMACDKIFRSEGALKNHEKSKKHLEKLEILKAMLEEEASQEENFAPQERSNIDPDSQNLVGEDSGLSETEESSLGSEADFKDENDPVKGLSEGEIEADQSTSDQQEVTVTENQSDNEEDQENGYESDSEMLAALLNIQKGVESVRLGEASKENMDEKEETGAEDMESLRNNVKENGAKIDEHQSIRDIDHRDTDAGSLEGVDGKASKKKSRRKQKSTKINPPMENLTPAHQPNLRDRKETRRKKGTQHDQNIDLSLTCSICDSEFSSRTKLFKHIKDSGHAALKNTL